jgi:RNA polymerase sigma-70 factor (ECF subfamily)
VYCVVPRDLSSMLHERLRRHFAATPGLEVVVESRAGARRGATDRRLDSGPVPDADRRRIANPDGRRIADRRETVPSVAPSLPPFAGPHAERLSFVAAIAPPGQRQEDLDTARLITRIQAGGTEEFGELYRRYFDRVYSYLRLALGDGHEAEDVTQQTFIQVLSALPRYENRDERFRSWLFVIVRHQALDRLRKLNRTDVEEPEQVARRYDESSDALGLEPLAWISDPELLLLIERLPLSQRQVLVLRYMMDLTSVDIGSILGRTPDDVRKLQQRALRFLHERLTALGRAPRGGRRPAWRRRVPQSKVLRSRRWSLAS